MFMQATLFSCGLFIIHPHFAVDTGYYWYKLSVHLLTAVSDKSKFNDSWADSCVPKSETRESKEKLDTFQKDIVKRSVYKLNERNEMMIKWLRQYLVKNENLSVSEYILMKLLHQMGFKYKKDCSNSRNVIC